MPTAVGEHYAIPQSVCPSPRHTATLGYRRAGCLQLSHVQTADPKVGGCRSTVSQTAIGGGGGVYGLAAARIITCLITISGSVVALE